MANYYYYCLIKDLIREAFVEIELDKAEYDLGMWPLIRAT